MSHSVPIKTQFKSKSGLFDSLKKLGWSVVTDQKCRTYPSDPARNTVHQYVAKNPQSSGYDVGFDINAETGEIVATCDWYGGSIARTLGQDFSELKKKYISVVAEEAGFEQQQILEQFADGSYILEVDDGQ